MEGETHLDFLEVTLVGRGKAEGVEEAERAGHAAPRLGVESLCDVV